MRKLRTRCSECEHVFCQRCGEDYHYTLSCEDNRTEKGLKKCRFCEKKRDPFNNRKACTKQICVNMGHQMCEKDLECGHDCYQHGDNYGQHKHGICLEPDCVKKHPQILDG